MKLSEETLEEIRYFFDTLKDYAEGIEEFEIDYDLQGTAVRILKFDGEVFLTADGACLTKNNNFGNDKLIKRIAAFIESNPLGEASRIRRLLIRNREEKNLKIIGAQKSELDDNGFWYAHAIVAERPVGGYYSADNSNFIRASATTAVGPVVTSDYLFVTRTSSGNWGFSFTTANDTGNN